MEISNRVRINLSQTSKSIIRRDMLIFNAVSSYKEGTFINDILKCFLTNEFSISYDYTSKNYKGESEVYYLSDSNVTKLDSFINEEGNASQYLTESEFLKALVESYCRLPCIERENIILHNKIVQLNEAIRLKQKVKITTYINSIIVCPYKIVPSNEALYSYLIAFDGENFNSIRLSMIQSLTIRKEKFNFPNSISLNHIEDLLTEFGPTFAFEPIETIQIQFLTKRAENSYLYSSLHRPVHTKILDKENRIYEFRCSSKQALYFFFRFAGYIKVISPGNLKSKFKEMYKIGYESCL